MSFSSQSASFANLPTSAPLQTSETGLQGWLLTWSPQSLLSLTGKNTGPPRSPCRLWPHQLPLVGLFLSLPGVLRVRVLCVLSGTQRWPPSPCTQDPFPVGWREETRVFGPRVSRWIGILPGFLFYEPQSSFTSFLMLSFFSLLISPFFSLSFHLPFIGFKFKG